MTNSGTRVLSLLVVAGILLLAVGLGSPPEAWSETTLQKIVRTKKFNMGYVLITPTAMKDPNSGELTGFHFDATRWICAQMKVECAYHEATWATFAAGLQAGKYDLSIAGTFATIPRAMAVAFVDPVYYKGWSAAALKSSNIKSMADLKKPGLRVAVIQGTSDHDWAVRNLPDAKLVVSTAEASVMLLDLIAGRADVGLTDSLVTALFVEKYPQVLDIFADRPYLINPVSWAVRMEDHDLLRFMNIAVAQANFHGVFAAIEGKYNIKGAHLRPTPPYLPSVR